MPARRRSPVRLVVAFVLVCAAPLVAAVATGTALPPSGADRTETAGGPPRGLAGHAGAGDETGPPGTGTADIPPTAGARGSGSAAPGTGRGPGSPGAGASASPTTAPPSTVPPGPTSTAAPSPKPPRPTPAEQVVALVNQARASASPACPALRVDVDLTQAAQAHSDDMVARNYFDHDTPDGIDFADRLLAAGYPRPGGENIAKGQTTAGQVMTAWMGSEGHRANILNCKFTAIGVGVNSTGWTWTQDFGY